MNTNYNLTSLDAVEWQMLLIIFPRNVIWDLLKQQNSRALQAIQRLVYVLQRFTVKNRILITQLKGWHEKNNQ